MTKGKGGKENEILNALETIQWENQELQHCYEKIVATRKALEAKWNEAESKLSSLIEEEQKLQAQDAVISMKIELVEKECCKLDEEHKTLLEKNKDLSASIKDAKEDSEAQIEKLIVEADKLSLQFLLALNDDGIIETECSKLRDEIDKIIGEIAEKEKNLANIKYELEEFDLYGLLDDPAELNVAMEDRQMIMNHLEDQILNAKSKLEDLNVMKVEKELEECELLKNI